MDGPSILKGTDRLSAARRRLAVGAVVVAVAAVLFSGFGRSDDEFSLRTDQRGAVAPGSGVDEPAVDPGRAPPQEAQGREPLDVRAVETGEPETGSGSEAGQGITVPDGPVTWFEAPTTDQRSATTVGKSPPTGARASTTTGRSSTSTTRSAPTTRSAEPRPPASRPPTTGPSTTRPSTTVPSTTPTTRRTTTSDPGPNPSPPGRRAKLGFSPGGWFPDESHSAMSADLDRMVEAGTTWLRIDFDWSEIERNRGTYHWHRTDRVVEEANRRGIKVLGLIGQSPSWARPPGLGSEAPPSDPAHFAQFAAAAAERYGSRGVEAWELWNEPNLAMFWKPRPDPAAYARLVVPAVEAIRAADPGTVVISGGLAPAADTADGTGISPETFVTSMLDAGAGVFDGYAIHPYSYPARPIDPSTASWNPFTNLPRFRDLVASKGQGGKPIWLTEYGAPTGTSSRAVSEAEQSAQISEALAAADGWSWTGPLFLYSHRDARNAPSDFQSNFGLMRNDGAAKQAWSDLVAANR